MKYTNFKIALIAFIICSFANCRQANTYEQLVNAIDKADTVSVDKTKNIAILVFNGADCISCNIVIDAAFKELNKSKIIPKGNNIILIENIRPIEMPILKSKFVNLSVATHFIIDKQLYQYFFSKIENDTHHSGGFIVLTPEAKQLMSFSIKDEQGWEKLINFTKQK